MFRLLVLIISIVGVFISFPLIGFRTEQISYPALTVFIILVLVCFLVVAKILGIKGEVKGGNYDFPMDD